MGSILFSRLSKVVISPCDFGHDQIPQHFILQPALTSAVGPRSLILLDTQNTNWALEKFSSFSTLNNICNKLLFSFPIRPSDQDKYRKEKFGKETFLSLFKDQISL